MSSVVVLTKNYAYWGERSIRDAVRLHCRGKIEILKVDESKVITAGISREGITFKMPAPLVIRLLDFVGYHIKKEDVRCTDAAVYERDRNVCQYWHYDEKKKRRFKYRCTTEERTIDHVIPKSRNGGEGFNNKVCCCRWHNEKVKKNHTPKEAALVLLREPRAPRFRKGDMAIITFSYNPQSVAHKAYNEYLGVQFSHEAS